MTNAFQAFFKAYVPAGAGEAICVDGPGDRPLLFRGLLRVFFERPSPRVFPDDSAHRLQGRQ